MNCKGCVRKRPWSDLRYLSNICLQEKPRKPCQHSRSPGRDFNQEPPKYETGVLPIRSQRSVLAYRCTVLTALQASKTSSSRYDILNSHVCLLQLHIASKHSLSAVFSATIYVIPLKQKTMFHTRTK
jgi:hypothetical protein